MQVTQIVKVVEQYEKKKKLYEVLDRQVTSQMNMEGNGSYPY